MKKSTLYTRTGDNGSTSLVGGQRIKKNDLRIETYGTIDELSATLGMIASCADCPEEIKKQLIEVQSRLFDIGAYLATDPDSTPSPSLYSLTGESVTIIEQLIDRLDAATPPIHAFVLPGGCELAARSHLARTVCRRAERLICTLNERTPVATLITEFVNRLSDYLFILARYLNHIGAVEETTWHS